MLIVRLLAGQFRNCQKRVDHFVNVPKDIMAAYLVELGGKQIDFDVIFAVLADANLLSKEGLHVNILFL